MKAYRIYNQDIMGFESDIKYSLNYSKAIQIFNDKIREEYKENDVIDRFEFREVIQDFRKRDDIEILCRTYPVIIYKKGNDIFASIWFWEKVLCEYDEYDIMSNPIILEEIELIEL